MSYKLYVDKNEDFECDVAVKNASLKNSIARLVVEAIDGPTLVFKGTIQGDKCVIPVKKLRGLLDENTKGKMHLEMVVEDTYFRPWESDFTVEEHTSVKVNVNEQKQSSSKPIVEVKAVKNKPIVEPKIVKSKPVVEPKTVSVPKKEIVRLCEIFNITKENFIKKQKDFKQIVTEYFKTNPEYQKHTEIILHKISDFLK